MNQDEFSALLKRWKVKTDIPASFRTEVWQRIADRREVKRAGVLEWLIARAARPRYAFSLACCTILLSLGLAQLEAWNTNAKNQRLLATRYSNSIDPFVIARE